MLKKYSGTMLRRFMTGLDNRQTLTASEPEKSLTRILLKVGSRHHGGREKRFYRIIDFKRNKYDLAGKVISVEYDPNRTANIALLHYPDGEKRYILHPEGLKVGDLVVSGKEAEVKLGNSLPLEKMPVGTIVHNINGQMIRSAGTSATVLAREGNYVTIKLSSGETRLVNKAYFATVGILGNVDWKNVNLGKAGRSRHMGRRPEVRGVAQNPRTHPHGGGEGRSGEGMNPKTPWGKPARGNKTRKPRKYSDRFIISHG